MPAGLAAAATVPVQRSRSQPLPGDFFRFADPVTETLVVRLTDPRTTSILPPASNRFVSSKRRFLIFSSDRSGKPAPFQLDLRTGRLRQLAQTDDLLPESLCMDEKERFVYLIDRSKLCEIALANLKIRTLAQEVTAFSPGVSPSEFVLVKQRHLQQLGGAGLTLTGEFGPCSNPMMRPGGRGCFFALEVSSDEREFWYAPLNSAESKPILLAKGRVSNPIWSADGGSLFFLREIETNVLLSELHEVFPETRTEQRVAPTSQFVAFAPNRNGSVFVGASRSKAQPNVLLLLRAVNRELTLCQHRSTHPTQVSPAFSPDSRRVYFQSDHEGKSALYSVNVEQLVEPTAI